MVEVLKLSAVLAVMIFLDVTKVDRKAVVVLMTLTWVLVGDDEALRLQVDERL